jgi:hypothetical protein
MAEQRIPNPDRSIPREFKQNISRLSIEASQRFNRRRFDAARELHEQILAVIERAQKSAGRPIHKGAPLYNIGVCFALTNRHNLALRNILLAYIEDTLNVAFGFEDEADRAPAAQMLRDFYGIRMDVLRTQKQIAYEVKQEDRWTAIFDPEELLQTLVERLGIDADNLSTVLTRPPPQIAPRQPLGFPQPWHERVFIGGNYQTHMPVIRHIENIVIALGYTPVIAFDVEMPRNLTHHHTLLLLHTCRYAIFEISSPAGQLMEIERTRDYENETLLLYSRISPDAAPSPLVSTMLQTTGLRTEGYTDLSDIDPIVRNFLPKVR